MNKTTSAISAVFISYALTSTQGYAHTQSLPHSHAETIAFVLVGFFVALGAFVLIKSKLRR